MPEISVGLFAEDRGHAEFVQALLHRLGREEHLSADVRLVSGYGGHGHAMSELRLYQRSIERLGYLAPAAVVVVAIDANCTGWNEKRAEIQRTIDIKVQSRAVIACPDPHVERWYLADPVSLADVLGSTVTRERRKCERDRYKTKLREAVLQGGHITTLGGIEFAQEIVDAMDLFRAGQNEPSLRAFLEDTRAKFRQFSSGGR